MARNAMTQGLGNKDSEKKSQNATPVTNRIVNGIGDRRTTPLTIRSLPRSKRSRDEDEEENYVPSPSKKSKLESESSIIYPSMNDSLSDFTCSSSVDSFNTSIVSDSGISKNISSTPNTTDLLIKSNLLLEKNKSTSSKSRICYNKSTGASSSRLNDSKMSYNPKSDDISRYDENKTIYKTTTEGTSITLDGIVRQYLANQHALCSNPVVTCPTFSLLEPHRCPEVKTKSMRQACTNILHRLEHRLVYLFMYYLFFVMNCNLFSVM